MEEFEEFDDEESVARDEAELDIDEPDEFDIAQMGPEDLEDARLEILERQQWLNERAAARETIRNRLRERRSRFFEPTEHRLVIRKKARPYRSFGWDPPNIIKKSGHSEAPDMCRLYMPKDEDYHYVHQFAESLVIPIVEDHMLLDDSGFPDPLALFLLLGLPNDGLALIYFGFINFSAVDLIVDGQKYQDSGLFLGRRSGNGVGAHIFFHKDQPFSERRADADVIFQFMIDVSLSPEQEAQAHFEVVTNGLLQIFGLGSEPLDLADFLTVQNTQLALKNLATPIANLDLALESMNLSKEM
jgi:hypothetical protein